MRQFLRGSEELVTRTDRLCLARDGTAVHGEGSWAGECSPVGAVDGEHEEDEMTIPDNQGEIR